MSAARASFSGARLGNPVAAPAAAAGQKGSSAAGTVTRGLQNLGLSQSRKDGVLYVPASYDPGRPAPLVLALHGAGANGIGALGAVLSQMCCCPFRCLGLTGPGRQTCHLDNAACLCDAQQMGCRTCA